MQENVDWREMYFTLIHATENAIRALMEAQKKREEMYVEAALEEKQEETP